MPRLTRRAVASGVDEFVSTGSFACAQAAMGAEKLAPHRRAGNRITGVQEHVGFFRAELIAVVGHVHPAVRVLRGECRIAAQPTTD